MDYIDGFKRPNIDYGNPFYNSMETQIIQAIPDLLSKATVDLDSDNSDKS